MTAAFSIGSEHRGVVEVFMLRQGRDAYAEVAQALGYNCLTLQADAPSWSPPLSRRSAKSRSTTASRPSSSPGRTASATGSPMLGTG